MKGAGGVRRPAAGGGHVRFSALEPHLDVLLTDVVMPGMSGTQLAAQIRRTRPGLPVLFTSGYTTGPAPGGQELPPDACLIRKPFDTPTLLRMLSEVLSVTAAG